jgi:hypothetical protein
MARITRVKKSLGSKIGEALGGVAAGINQFQQGQQEREKMEIMKQQAERQKEELLMRQEEHQVKMEKVHEQRRMAGASLFMKLSGQYVEAEDKKDFEDANVELMYKAATAGEIPIATAGNIFKVARAHGPKYNIAARQVERGLSAVTTKAWNTMSESDRELAYKEGRAGFAAMRDMDQGNAQHWAGAQEQWEKRWHDKSMQSQKASDARSLHQLKELESQKRANEVSAQRPSKDTEAYLTDRGKMVSKFTSKDVKVADNIVDATNNLFKNLPDVSTGAVTGSKIVWNTRKLFDKGVQEVNANFKKMQLETFLDFIDRAGGVRGMDTPPEQERVVEAYPSSEKATYVNMYLAANMKAGATAMKFASERTQEYIDQGMGPSDAFTQASRDLKQHAVFVDVRGDVQLVKDGQEVPQGYVPVKESRDMFKSAYSDNEKKEFDIDNFSPKVNKAMSKIK